MADQVRRRTRSWAEPAAQWQAKVQHWVDAGIVSSNQGDEILALETSGAAVNSEECRREPSQSSISPVVEVVSYVAIVVVVCSSVLFLGHYWSGIGVAGRVSVSLLVIVASLLGGFVVAQIGDAGASRLSALLELIGTAGAALATAAAVGPVGEHHHGLTLLGVGVVVLALSVSLWRNRNRSLQFLTSLLGLVLTVSALGTVAHLHATSTEVAMFEWLLAVAIGLMSLQMLRPARTALVVAVLGSFVGAFALSFPNHLAGTLLGLISTTFAVALGFALVRPAIIVLGAVGFFMFDFRIFTIYLRSTNAARGAFILGLVLVTVGLWHATYTTKRERLETTAPLELRPETELYEPW
jgi:hypothetical protein